MDRRDLVKGGALAVTALGATAFAAKPAKTAKGGTDVASTAAECLKTGYACTQHCITQMGEGNKSMKNCLEKVQAMLIGVDAMIKYASLNAASTKKFAKICAEDCAACAAACKEHESHWKSGMHLECKACYEACIACEKACKAYAA